MTDDLTEAERQMIELLQNDQHISLAISKDEKGWHMRLEDHDAGLVGDGHGRSFAQAWDDIQSATRRRAV